MMATEIRHLQRTEVREAEEAFRAGQKGSSAMPHKRNPIKSEQLSGLARVLRGYLGAGLEDVALWHERDISHSSVERIILPDASLLAYYVLVRMAELIDGLVVSARRMLANFDLSYGLVFSQPVLLSLIQGGLTQRRRLRRGPARRHGLLGAGPVLPLRAGGRPRSDARQGRPRRGLRSLAQPAPRRPGL